MQKTPFEGSRPRQNNEVSSQCNTPIQRLRMLRKTLKRLDSHYKCIQFHLEAIKCCCEFQPSSSQVSL
uniref:Ovule protein n=1 Tax=Ascaris lumbricoides TaxID=6252 RepID=A0A0M3HFG0_ASCLU